jgi:hypothetical protein
MSIVTLQHPPSRRSLAPASIRLRSIPLSLAREAADR